LTQFPIAQGTLPWQPLFKGKIGPYLYSSPWHS